jgi:hypothetical protein
MRRLGSVRRSMQRYDPFEAPDPAEWLALDEGERQLLVETYHRRARIRLPNAVLHAVIHVVVENQAALGDELPVQRTIQRLMDDGLDRHEAVHAVGSVLGNHLFDIMQGRAASKEAAQAAYNAAVERLTVESWRAFIEKDADKNR